MENPIEVRGPASCDFYYQVKPMWNGKLSPINKKNMVKGILRKLEERLNKEMK